MGFAVVKVFIAVNHTKRKKAPAEKLGFLFMPRKEDRNLGKGIAPDGVYIPS